MSDDILSQISNNQTEAQTVEQENINSNIIDNTIEEEPEESISEVTQKLFDIDHEKQVRLMAAEIKHAKSVEALASSHIAMNTVILYMAEQLGVQLSVMKYDAYTGESVSYRINVNREGSYSAKEMPAIIAMVKAAVDRSAGEVKTAKNKLQSAEEKIISLQRELQDSRNLVHKLSIEVRHPNIEKDAFVLAYINDKGNFRYLGNIEKHGKTIVGRVKDFSAAKKFATINDAYVTLIELLQNYNHPITMAYQMKIYSASLIEITKLPGSDTLIKLREKAEVYEQQMKVDNAQKVKKQRRKEKRRRLIEKSASDTSRKKLRKHKKSA